MITPQKQDHAGCHREEYVLCESGNQIGGHAAAADRKSVRKLCGYMVYMVALCTGGGHDRVSEIGDM